jgi:hypothetical protein
MNPAAATRFTVRRSRTDAAPSPVGARNSSIGADFCATAKACATSGIGMTGALAHPAINAIDHLSLTRIPMFGRPYPTTIFAAGDAGEAAGVEQPPSQRDASEVIPLA